MNAMPQEVNDLDLLSSATAAPTEPTSSSSSSSFPAAALLGEAGGTSVDDDGGGGEGEGATARPPAADFSTPADAAMSVASWSSAAEALASPSSSSHREVLEQGENEEVGLGLGVRFKLFFLRHHFHEGDI